MRKGCVPAASCSAEILLTRTFQGPSFWDEEADSELGFKRADAESAKLESSRFWVRPSMILSFMG